MIISGSKDDSAKGRAPRFIQPIMPQTVPEEEVVIMEAEVDSIPTCSFQWFHNDLPIKVGVQIIFQTLLCMCY